MPTARALSRGWTSRSATGSSWCSSARPAAARRRRCAWSPASRASARASLRIGERVVNHVPARDRDIAMVFQSYALYPHLTVYDNIAFGLRLRKAPKDEIDQARARSGTHPRAHGVPRAEAESALGRPAPAGCDGPSDRPTAPGVSHGRAPLEPRREAACAHAGGDREPAERARRDDDLRHARPGRGDDDGRSRRGHAQGRAAAGRSAAAALRAPGQSLRRRLHRLPGDEHGGGDDLPARTASSRCRSESTSSR